MYLNWYARHLPLVDDPRNWLKPLKSYNVEILTGDRDTQSIMFSSFMTHETLRSTASQLAKALINNDKMRHDADDINA